MRFFLFFSSKANEIFMSSVHFCKLQGQYHFDEIYNQLMLPVLIPPVFVIPRQLAREIA